MSLDVGVQRGDEVDCMLSFEDDGYYWFLHPLFKKMHKSVGIYIDLYGDAEFKKDNIVHLESLLKEAENMISKEPSYWNVLTGIQTHPERKEIYCKVSKSEIENKLKILDFMVSEVKAANSKLVFLGD
ncbi:MAG: hypothetical protein ABFR63_08490 [Thermodesulfobacteriota bacterium]